MRTMFFSFSVLVMLFSQDLFASPKTDSIVAFLGGAHAKIVWMRWAWCNDTYAPKTQAQAANAYSLMLMDTREGTERALLSGLNKFESYSIRISRTGKWVTYMEGTKTMIVNLTVQSPTKTVFLDKSNCTYWAVRATWIDPANGTEYAFCLDNPEYPNAGQGNGIYKVKINADGTADRGSATKLTISGNPKIDEMFSVSADGKKLGGAFPWPNVKILDIPTGQLLNRHAGGFGCQPNLAPDNSYRLYHCEGDHLGIMMFGSNLQDNANWFVNLSANLAGVSNTTGRTVMDFAAPRWSNHVQYLTGTWPMGDNYESYCGLECGMDDNGSLWNKSATWVQTQINMLKVPKFFLGKFSADFKSQEKSILVASDQRYMQYGGDAWICNGTTYGNACGSTAVSNVLRTGTALTARIQRTGSSMIIHTGSDVSSVIRVSDAWGRVVRTMIGAGTCILDAQDLTAGAYLVSVTAGDRSETMRMPLTTR